MEPETQIFMYGSLQKAYLSQKNLPLRLRLKTEAPMLDVLKDLDIDAEKVQLVMVNCRSASKDCRIKPGDRLALFPREYPIFADWKDYRL